MKISAILSRQAGSGNGLSAFQSLPSSDRLQNCTLAPIWVRKMPKKEAEIWRCITLSG